MGGKLGKQQSYIHNSNCPCGSHDEKRSCKYKASDYGSWTNLTKQTPSPTRRDAVVSNLDLEHSSERSVSNQGGVQPVSSSTLLLTQPPSEAQDCLIRGVAPKLIDVRPDVVQKQDLFKSSVTNNALEALTPENAALHYSLITTPELSPSEAQSRKKIIAKSLLEHMETLIDQVQPDEVAAKLYGIGVLDIDELHRASDMQEAVDDRTRELVRLLKRKLWLSPEWFVDICKILRNCGVKVITQVIDEVYSACPTEEMSILSTGRSFSCSTSTVKTSIRKSSLPSYHDMIMKIVDSFNEDGLQAATELLQKYTAEQGGDLQLIHRACQCGVDVSTLDLLLDILDQAGDNHITNSKDECGRTPLHEACAALKPRSADDEQADALEGNVEQRLKIEHLMTHGANYCSKDMDGNTALHLAVLRSDCEAVSALLRSGKRCINIVNKRGNTALHLAARRGQVDILKVLCYHKANTSTQNNKTLTALHLACIHNHIDAAIELASRDQSTLDAFDKYHMTPLHICCKKGYTLLALALLRHKNCSTFKMDKDSRTPLHYAVSGGNVSLVTALLLKDELNAGRESKGLMVDIQDRYGDTALHIAGRLGNKPIAKQLLNYRANKDILNQEGKNPLEVAIECEHDIVAAKLMRKRGWHQHRKTMKRVYKLRRTLTQSTLSTTFQSEVSDNVDMTSSESEDDENVGSGKRRNDTP